MIVEYNPKAKKFEIQCTFAENSIIAALPGKRYQRRRELWQAPALSRSAEFMLSNDTIRAAMSPAALEMAEKTLERSKVKRVPFPGWYPFKTQPFKHQMSALDHCWGLDRHAFFMEMGTGKSKVAIDLASARFMAAEIEVWVVFCPNAVRDNWVDEIRVHCPLTDIPVTIIGDLTKKKREKIAADAARAERLIIVAGMESVQQKFRGGQVFDTIIEVIGGRKYAVTVDESHLIKNPDANRSRNVGEIASSAVAANVMTGSPIAQGILDLYMQFQVLDPNIIGVGDYYSFRNRYAEMGGFENRQVVGYLNVEELMGLVRPYVYQCTKEEALDLPDKLYTRRIVDMSKEQAKAYEEINKEHEAKIQDLAHQGIDIEVIADQILTQYNALQQITGGFVNYDHVTKVDDYGEPIESVRRSAWLVEPKNNPKVKELMAVAEEYGGKPMIVWAKFRNEIAIIVEALQLKYGEGCVSEYHGGLTKDERKESMRKFKAGETKFFVANQQTGGTGLTINEANLVVYFSNSLKLVERLQSEDRNHRIGQKNDVLYIDLVCRGTKDVDVMQAVRDKKEIADYVKEQMSLK